MERVLIVAKTHMGDHTCVGALTRSTNRGVRLLAANGAHQPVKTEFHVGQLWDINFRKVNKIIPPHVEDVAVTDAHYAGQIDNIREVLMQRVHLWQGGPEQLYDRLLVCSETAGYISRDTGIPSCSTGYWLTDRILRLIHIHDRVYYEVKCDSSSTARCKNKNHKGTIAIPYVGFAKPVAQLPPQTLLRVSLARWWRSNDEDEERCYLQLSGWYL